MQITMIGHSTLVIEMAGKKIITDPYFGLRGHIAYRRLAPPAQPREALTDVDVVLVSHNHWDHIDRAYFHMLSSDVPVIAPNRVKWATSLRGAKNVVGIQPWESRQFGTVVITGVPATHLTVTVGFVIQGEGRQVYFAGDTFYRPFMEQIGRQFQLDVALMPVTTYRIPMTMGEKSAVRAVGDLEPGYVIPIHLGVEPRSPLLRTRQTPEGFIRRLHTAELDTEVILLKEGESWSL